MINQTIYDILINWLIDWFQYQCGRLFLRTRCPLHDPTQNVQQAFHSGRDQILLQQRKFLIYQVIALQISPRIIDILYLYWCTKDTLIKFNDIYAYVLFSYFTWRENECILIVYRKLILITNELYSSNDLLHFKDNVIFLDKDYFSNI